MASFKMYLNTTNYFNCLIKYSTWLIYTTKTYHLDAKWKKSEPEQIITWFKDVFKVPETQQYIIQWIQTVHNKLQYSL